MNTLRFVVGLSLALASAIASQAAPSKFLVQNPFDFVSLSPGGVQVAMTARGADGKMVVNLVETSGFKVDPFVVSDGKGGNGDVTDLRWLDDKWLALISKGEKDANWLHVFAVGDKSPTRLAKEGRRAIVATIPGTTRFLVSTRPDGDVVGTCQLLEYDAAQAAAEPRVVYAAESKSLQCVVDRKGRLRLVKKTDASGGEAWYRVDIEGGTEARLEGLKPWMQVSGIDGDGPNAIVLAHLSGSFPGLHTYDIVADKAAQMLADHDQYSVVNYGKPVFDNTSGRMVGLHLDTAVYASFWSDPSLQKIQDTIDAELGGSTNRVHDWSGDRNVLLVERIFSLLPRQYYLVDLKAKRYSAIAHCGGKVTPDEVGPTRLIEVPNRDGVPLPVILTLPAKRAGGKLPLVVWIRKGVWSGVDRVEWHPEANYFAADGYAVLRVNYRGGDGLLGPLAGDTSKKEGILNTFRDIDDAVKAFVDAGVVDPERIAIGGEAEGAWAAAYAATLRPEAYQAVLCFNGLYDLMALRDEKTGGDASGGMSLNFARHYGSLGAAEVESLSVVHNLKAYPKHVFVTMGKWSPAEYKSQVTEFVKALKKVGVTAKQQQGDWWGGSLSGLAREEAFTKASAVLKAAFK